LGYLKAFKAIFSTFKEAIVVTNVNFINQNGVYIFFDGSVANNKVEDTLSFSVAVASHTLTKENGAMRKVDELRLQALNSNFDIDFKRCKAVSFESSSLYIVALEFTIKINVKDNYES